MDGHCGCFICQHPSEHKEFCDALERLFGITAVLVTEDSSISDFGHRSEVEELSAALSVPIALKDHVHEVYARMAEREIEVK